MEKENILSLKELEDVVGGRSYTEEEKELIKEFWARYLKLQELYKSRNMYYSHWPMIEEEFNKAARNWAAAINAAPESGPTISFYDYFDFEYWENY